MNIEKIKINSKEILEGDTFISLKKGNFNYIKEAIKKGAEKIIYEDEKDIIDIIKVKSTKKFLEDLLFQKYYKEIKDLNIYAVTGTNGKTTTAFLIKEMFEKFNEKCAYIGTIGAYINNLEISLNNTTPDLLTIYKLLLKCKKESIKNVAIEVSSHAIKQDRIKNILFNAAIFTNLTEDHLDYHKTIKNYAKVKSLLFDKLKNKKIAIINKDDSYSNTMINTKNKNIFYSYKNADYKIENLDINFNKTKFTFKNENKIYKVESNLIGKFNVENLMSVIILFKELGYPINEIIEKCKILKLPKGRMEVINNKNNMIIIDYAHTPDAVLKVLENLNMIKKNKIYTILGCGGNREKEKRPIMGNIASNLSDYLIITSDNPRNEDPLEIINDIKKGIKKENFEVIEERDKAIKSGISKLKNGDILVILGKGHEEYQIVKNKKQFFSDKKEVEKYICKGDTKNEKSNN